MSKISSIDDEKETDRLRTQISDYHPLTMRRELRKILGLVRLFAESRLKPQPTLKVINVLPRVCEELDVFTVALQGICMFSTVFSR